jgi:hypothetical protein
MGTCWSREAHGRGSELPLVESWLKWGGVRGDEGIVGDQGRRREMEDEGDGTRWPMEGGRSHPLHQSPIKKIKTFNTKF